MRQRFVKLWKLRFLSTLSLRRATRRSVKLFRQNYISIHALLAESDKDADNGRNADLHFYPRSPCGERLVHTLKLANTMLFLSTLSLRRATKLRNPSRPGKINFYPRSPCGERRRPRRLKSRRCVFLSTLSLRRATYLDRQNPKPAEFLSTLSLRRATLARK